MTTLAEVEQQLRGAKLGVNGTGFPFPLGSDDMTVTGKWADHLVMFERVGKPVSPPIPVFITSQFLEMPEPMHVQIPLARLSAHQYNPRSMIKGVEFTTQAGTKFAVRSLDDSLLFSQDHLFKEMFAALRVLVAQTPSIKTFRRAALDRRVQEVRLKLPAVYGERLLLRRPTADHATMARLVASLEAVLRAGSANRPSQQALNAEFERILR